MSYSFADSFRAGSGWNAVPSWTCSKAVSKTVWHIPMLCVQWKTPDGQKNCPKHVDFHFKKKFEKLVHLVGFIIRNLPRCTVTWTSNAWNWYTSWGNYSPSMTGGMKTCLTLILRRFRTGTVWFYTSTSNKRAARPKLYTKSLTRDLKRTYSRFTLVRISINL